LIVAFSFSSCLYYFAVNFTVSVRTTNTFVVFVKFYLFWNSLSISCRLIIQSIITIIIQSVIHLIVTFFFSSCLFWNSVHISCRLIIQSIITIIIQPVIHLIVAFFFTSCLYYFAVDFTISIGTTDTFVIFVKLYLLWGFIPVDSTSNIIV